MSGGIQPNTKRSPASFRPVNLRATCRTEQGRSEFLHRYCHRMSDVEESFDENDSTVSPKKGKKKYYPFGTPTHNSVPYSKFAHLNNAQTQEFATQLSSTSSSLLVREPQPERPKRNPTKKTASKATSSADTPAPEVIPDAEGLEPCTKIACQQVIRTITELQFRNEVERDEIEDEYERLLQDLAGAEQEIAAAEAKLVTLNDIGSQLEMRSNQLQEKVESLQNTKDAQDTERNDINGKVQRWKIRFFVVVDHFTHLPCVASHS
jgi:hypothetical protein